MKIDNVIKSEIEIAAEQAAPVEYKRLGSYVKRVDGGKLFEYSISTGELKEAVFRTDDTFLLGGANKAKLDVNPNCIYLEALNLKNALKHLKKGNWVFKS